MPPWQSLPRPKCRTATKSEGARWLETWHLAPSRGALSPNALLQIERLGRFKICPEAHQPDVL
jgi:hypothetical protein